MSKNINSPTNLWSGTVANGIVFLILFSLVSEAAFHSYTRDPDGTYTDVATVMGDGAGNGNFEGTGNGSTAGWRGTSGASISASNDVASEGRYSLKIEGGNQNSVRQTRVRTEGQLDNTLNAAAGDIFHVTLDYYVDTADDFDQVIVYVVATKDGAPIRGEVWTVANKQNFTVGKWNSIDVYGQTDNTDLNGLHFRVEFRRSRGGTTPYEGYIDNVIIRQIAATGLPSVDVMEKEPEPPIPIRFELERPGYVTLVVEDADGIRVRNLVSGEFFEAGEQVVWWDGLNEGRKIPVPRTAGIYDIARSLVTPGEYRVRGLVRDEIQLKYDFTVYPNCGNPPWPTNLRIGAGGWLADHAMPHAAVFIPAERAPGGVDQVALASTVAECSQAMAWVDMDGNKIAGRWRVGGRWTGASHLVFDRGNKPHPDIYMYSMMGWKRDAPVKGVDAERQAEIRLMGFIGHDAIPVAFIHPELPEGKTWQDIDLRGLAVHNGLLVYSERLFGKLHFLDTRSVSQSRQAHLLGSVTLAEAGDLCFDTQGRLLALVGNELHRYTLGDFPEPLSAPERLVSDGLQDPQRLAIGPTGLIYITDWGSSHQVKIFSPDTGDLLSTIGKAGAPATGAYDPQHMNRPLGVAVSDDAHVWVAEKFRVPKRVSQWTTEGKLVRAFYGPPGYGGGGELDRENSDRFYYAGLDGGMEFKLDWGAGTAVPSRIYWLAEDTPFLTLRWRGLMHPHRFRGHRYLSNDYSGPTSGHPLLVISRDDGDKIAPVALVGNAANWPYLEETGLLDQYAELKHKNPGVRHGFIHSLLVCWGDRNGDGRPQNDEIQLRPRSEDTSMGTILSVSLDDNFNAVITHSKGVLYAPLDALDETGVPYYDLAKITPLVSDTDIKSTSGGGQTFIDGQGRVVVTGGPMRGFEDGRQMWRYHSRWPSLHAGHTAPGQPEFPGQLLATTRLLGPPITVNHGDAGELWAVNSDKGVVYLLTTDGLFVDALGAYVRDGRRWNMPEAKRGMDLTDVNMLSEHFFPTLAKLDNGDVYLVAGISHSSLVRVEGLESVRRLPARRLPVSAEQLHKARQYHAELVARESKGEQPDVLVVTWADDAVAVDGDFADWPELNWVVVNMTSEENGWRQPVQVPETSVALTIDEKNLYIAVQTREMGLLDNAGTDPQTVFRTGGALDLRLATATVATESKRVAAEGDVRLLVARVEDEPFAVLYRPVVPDADGEPITFTSPMGTVVIDQIQVVSNAITMARRKQSLASTTNPDKSYPAEHIEISVPLATLGWDPRKLPKTSGDIGVLIGRDGETVDRTYWHNKTARIVSDIPSEASLAPDQWGSVKAELED